MKHEKKKRVKKNVLVFGAEGMLGKEFCYALRKNARYRVFPASHRTADITDESALAGCMKKVRPDIVINCAAFINVDACEDHVLKAWQVNALGPGNIVRALGDAKLRRAVFVHISTSDVFGNNKKAYREPDTPHPVNAYGGSKYGGENNVEHEARSAGLRYYIVRTSWIYSRFRETYFIDTVAKALARSETLTLVSDQKSVPTWTRDLVRSVLPLCFGRNNSGTYHVVNDAERAVSKYEIALEIKRILCFGSGALRPGAARARLRRAFRKDIFKVERPASPFLINTKLPKLPHWKRSLKEYILSLHLV